MFQNCRRRVRVSWAGVEVTSHESERTGRELDLPPGSHPCTDLKHEFPSVKGPTLPEKVGKERERMTGTRA